MNQFLKLKEVLTSIETDVDKFYNKGNKEAGTRIRKAMLDLKMLAHNIRIDIVSTRSVSKK